MRVTPRRALRAAIAVAVVAFLWFALRDQWAQVGDRLSDLSALSLLAGGVALLGALLASMQLWRVLLADMGSPLGAAAAARVFFLSQLGKYLPGSVWTVVGQMELGRDHAVPRARMAASTLISLAVAIVTGLVVAAATLPFVLVGEARRWLWLAWLIPLGLVALHPRVLAWGFNTLLRLIRRPPLQQLPTVRGLAAAGGWAVVVWACYGIHVWLLARDLGAGGGPDVLALAIGAYAAAWSLGFLFVIAPAGAGVREGALVLTLGTVLTLPAATLLALVSRLLVTFAELAWALVALVMARRARPGAADPEPAGDTSAVQGE